MAEIFAEKLVIDELKNHDIKASTVKPAKVPAEYVIVNSGTTALSIDGVSSRESGYEVWSGSLNIFAKGEVLNALILRRKVTGLLEALQFSSNWVSKVSVSSIRPLPPRDDENGFTCMVQVTFATDTLGV